MTAPRRRSFATPPSVLAPEHTRHQSQKELEQYVQKPRSPGGVLLEQWVGLTPIVKALSLAERMRAEGLPIWDEISLMEPGEFATGAEGLPVLAIVKAKREKLKDLPENHPRRVERAASIAERNQATAAKRRKAHALSVRASERYRQRMAVRTNLDPKGREILGMGEV